VNGILKYLILITGSLFVRTTVSSQEADLRTLNLQLKNARHDTSVVKLSNLIGEMLYTGFPDSARAVWERSIQVAEKNIASEDKENVKLRSFYKEQLGIMLSNVSYIYYQRGDLQITFENLERSLKINEELNNKRGIANSLNAIGYIYDAMGDVTNALEYFHRSLKINEQLNDKRGMGVSLNNIGYIYDDQGDLQKALEFYLQDLKLREEIKDEEGIANSVNNIGTILERQGNFQEALKYYDRSLKISESHKDKYGIALTLLNIGAVQERQNKLKEALENFSKSLVIRKELNEKDGITRSLRRIANIYITSGNLREAAQYAEESLKISRELGFPSNIAASATILTDIYSKQNRYKEAFEMFELENKMNDSIYSEKTRKATVKKQFQFAYEKKAARDSIRHNEEQKVKTAQLTAQEAQLEQERTQRFVLYGGGLLVLGFSGFIFNRFRLTQKQKKTIALQKEKMDLAYSELHEKNKEVMDSINYARRIQSSLLPSEKYITRILEKKNSIT
jgi:tetratricopeptide (TPR) repeat protein